MKDFIRHEGIVKDVSGGVVYVSVVQQAACAGCQVKSTCFSVSDKERIIEVPLTNLLFERNERVLVKMHTRSGLKAVWYAFVFPLLLLFMSVFIVFRLELDEPLIALVAIGTLVLYFAFLFLFKDQINRKFTFELEKCN